MFRVPGELGTLNTKATQPFHRDSDPRVVSQARSKALGSSAPRQAFFRTTPTAVEGRILQTW